MKLWRIYSVIPMKSKAIICDIDGTLAHKNGRNPYDPTRYKDDLVDEAIKSLLEILYMDGCWAIILLSGRDAFYRGSTLDWLYKHKVPFDRLFMRPTNSRRKDADIKMELYFKYVEPEYNVVFVLDDRQRVVDMWREIGLKCLQVQKGDF